MTSNQMIRFFETVTISVNRESDNSHMYWFVAGDIADWVGFMDDYGTFIPVDWC